MDYDSTNIPSKYDAARDISKSAKYQQLEFFAKHLSEDTIADILDLGCGTARYSAALAEVFRANVVGIDPSQKMIDRARAKLADCCSLKFELGSGEALPLGQKSFDMIFLSMVLHHLPDPTKTVLECNRVLRNGGVVCIRNTMADEVSTYPYLEFFPSIQTIILTQLIYRQHLVELFKAQGFELAAHQTSWSEISGDWPSFANKMALKADSFVARLEEDEFQEGLKALQEKAIKTPGENPIGLNVDSFVFRKT